MHSRQNNNKKIPLSRFATVFTVTQVVGGDFFGILAALKYRVIVNGQQKKLRQGLKGKKGFKKKASSGGNADDDDDEEEDEYSPNHRGQNNNAEGAGNNGKNGTNGNKNKNGKKDESASSGWWKRLAVLASPFTFIWGCLFPKPDKKLQTGIDSGENDVSTGDKVKRYYQKAKDIYAMNKEMLKPWKVRV